MEQPQAERPEPALVCKVCSEPVEGAHVNANSNRYHASCFVCYQCLEPFPGNVFFEAEDRYLCEFDYTILHGARCGRCAEIIRGKCITAMDIKWHPDHFTCENCGKPLAGTTFVKRNGKPYCKPCLERLKIQEQQMEICERCKKPIIHKTDHSIVINHKTFHAHHFNCALCKTTLAQNVKQLEGKLYCADCGERISMRVCQACRRPIEGRSVTALGKMYHPEHFVCSKCEKPFNSSVYWEYNGKPYCEAHYHELTGDVCGLCYEPVVGNTVTAMNRKWCENHFMCMSCHVLLAAAGTKMEFIDWDLKPFCKKCYEELPVEVRKRVGKDFELEKKAAAAASKT